MKAAILSAVLLVCPALLAACSGASAPTAPTPVASTVSGMGTLDAATIVAVDGGTAQCFGTSSCSIHLPMKNIGIGCANAVRGSAVLKNAQGQALGTYSWSNGTLLVRQGESFVVLLPFLPTSVGAMATYDISPAWTNVSCQ